MDEQLGLTPEQMQQLQKWLTAKTRGKSVSCQVCQLNKWNVLDNFVVLKTVAGSGEETEAAYPHVALSCTNCGQTLLLNALKAGLWQR